jgi:hypothetical protein
MSAAPSALGRRVIVTGLAGSGKSTFSLALAAKTGLPVIHLDLHFWKPGWVAPSETEWREKQSGVLGFRMPDELPEGCDYSAWSRLRDEWLLALRIGRKRSSDPEREHAIISEQGQHVALHVLRSKRAVRELLDGLDADHVEADDG